MRVLVRDVSHRCPVSCIRSAQKFSGKKNKNMKRQNRVRAAYNAFLLRVLQVAFGYAAVLNTSKESMAFNCSLPPLFG